MFCDGFKVHHEGNTMQKIMGNKPQLSSAIIIRAKTGTFSIETLDVHLAP
jgi:hypothetical protein